MATSKNSNNIHIQLHTYQSIENGVVLTRAATYNWHLTPKTRYRCQQNIKKTVALEQAKKRTLLFFEDGKQVIKKGFS
jgi:hypothetical protein